MGKKKKKSTRDKINDKYYKVKADARFAALWAYDKDIAYYTLEIVREIAFKVDDADEFDLVLDDIVSAVSFNIDRAEDRKKYRKQIDGLPETVEF